MPKKLTKLQPASKEEQQRFQQEQLERQELIQKAYHLFTTSPLAWGMTIFQHHFSQEPAPFHIHFIKAAMEEQKLAVIAPRGSAKSTILAFLYVFHCLAFKRKRYIIMIASTERKAAEHLETIKAEMDSNEQFKQWHPGIKLKVSQTTTSVFRHPDGFETKIACFGQEQVPRVRGTKFGAYRPDLIVGDDMEDDELVRSPERRRQFQEDFDNALIPCVNVMDYQLIFIGTFLHDDCMIAKLTSKDLYQDYEKLKYKALYTKHSGEQFSVWPERMSVDWLNEKKAKEPSTFAKEYQGNPVYGDEQRFHKHYFHQWRLEGKNAVLLSDDRTVKAIYPTIELEPAISCDLAWEDKRRSDYSVIMPGYLTPNKEILIDKYIHKKGLRPHQIYEIIFPMVARMEALTNRRPSVGFEKAKLEKVIKHLLKEEMRRRNEYLTFKELAWDGDKVQRIMTRLEPRYNQGLIYHHGAMGELESELLRFPTATHDDLADAAQGLVQILKYPRTPSKKSNQSDNFSHIRKLFEHTNTPRRNFRDFSTRGRRSTIQANTTITIKPKGS